LSQSGRKRRRYGSNVELRVLGELQASVADCVVQLRPVERRLVSALAVRHRGAVRYESLADAVWGDVVPRSATRSLQTHVLRVRSAAGFGSVETVSGGYRLGATVSVDVDAFTARLGVAAACDDPIAALEAWDEALALWRGVPFEELEDWPPAVVERARLTEMWQRGLEDRCAVALAGRPPFDVVAEAQALVEAEPLRERRWCLLMTSLDTAGRRAEAVRVFDQARRVLAVELGISPGHELTELHRALLREEDGSAGAPVQGRPRRRSTGNLPTPLATIIGREGLIEQVRDLVMDARLLTLTGTGGVGKTRLALAVGETLRGAVSGGVWFVELARSSEPDTIDALVAAALGVVTRGGGQKVREVVLEVIGDRQMVLVLDNCEHLLAAVTDFVIDALGRCGRLRILTTSREPLSLPGERTMVVPSLHLDGPASELFIARACDADPSFAADDALVAAISRQLDGIPLAIEPAAARVRTIGIVELARQLDERSGVLGVPGGGRDERHRTVRAALDWSYDRLDDSERLVFEQLSVFHGRFELDAVRRVVTGAATTDVLASLIDKSMVLADGVDPARFRMLEPLRQYATQRLSSTGTERVVAMRHAQCYAELARQLDDLLAGRDELLAAARIDAAQDNLRFAFHTATRDHDVAGALTIAAHLTRYARTRIWSEPWTWCEAALTLPGAVDHPLRAAALVGASDGAWQLGDHARSVELADAAIALAAAGCRAWCDAHVAKASALVWLGRLDDAIAAATAAARQPDAISYGAVTSLSVLGLILNLAGRPDPILARRLLNTAQALGNPTALALAFHTAGVILGRDQPVLAVQYQHRAAELAAATGAVLIQGFALTVLAAQETGDPVQRGRAQLDVMHHYLRVGNRTHLRSFARGLLEPLITLSAHEAAAVLDGATQDQPELAVRAAGRATPIVRTRLALGAGYEAAAARGASMTDDELVAYLDDTVAVLEQASVRGAY
jgi:predicted ATPase/DNA-binding SARP family transcriptional activator